MATMTIDREIQAGELAAIQTTSQQFGDAKRVAAFMLFICRCYKAAVGSKDKQGKEQPFGLLPFNGFIDVAKQHGFNSYRDGKECESGNNDLDQIKAALLSARLLDTRPRTKSLVWCGLKPKTASSGSAGQLARLIQKFSEPTPTAVMAAPPTPVQEQLAGPTASTAGISKRDAVLTARLAAIAPPPLRTAETHDVDGCGQPWESCTCPVA